MNKLRTIIERSWRLIKFQLLQKDISPQKKALSIALGIFFSILPIWSVQTIAALAAAHLLKLHKGIVLLSVSISMFPVTPFILYASFIVGGMLMEDAQVLTFNMNLTFDDFTDYLYQYLIGSFLLAPIAAVVAGICSYTLFIYIPPSKKNRNCK